MELEVRPNDLFDIRNSVATNLIRVIHVHHFSILRNMEEPNLVVEGLTIARDRFESFDV